MLFRCSVLFGVLVVQHYQFLTPAQAVNGVAPPAQSTLCEPNLGANFGSAELGIAEWPTLNGNLISGHDDGISFFVGGNYECQAGAEIEGVVVVLGDFTVKAGNTLSNIGVVGQGSSIVPTAGGDNMIVGGHLVLDKKVQYMFTRHGDVLVGNTVSGTVGQLEMNEKGTIYENVNIDLLTYTNMFDDLYYKSQYWSSLPQNGEWTHVNTYDPFTFQANTADDLQVFHIDTSQLQFPYGVEIKFDASLQKKTILINVKSDDNGVAKLTNLANFFDGIGGNNHDFDPQTTAHIIWNFYDATEVHLGGGGSGNGEFIGTVLIPTPNSNTFFTFPGHSGRFIANGNVIQNKAGSEFHNYAFQPVTSLPNPPEILCPPESDDDDTLPTESTAPTTAPRPHISVDDDGCSVEMTKRYLQTGQVEWTTVKTCRNNCDCPPEELE